MASLVPYAIRTPVASASTTTQSQQDWEDALRTKQSTVRGGVFGTTYANEFIRLSLTAAPDELQRTNALGPAGEPLTWTTVFLGPEMISEAALGELTAQQIQDLDAIRAEAYLIVGTLQGPNGTSHVVGLYHTATDQNEVEYHHLVPIGEASPALVSSLTEMVQVVQTGPIAVGKRPCDSLTHCHDLYRQRIADALRQFARCMKGQAPPNVAVRGGLRDLVCSIRAWYAGRVSGLLCSMRIRVCGHRCHRMADLRG